MKKTTTDPLIKSLENEKKENKNDQRKFIVENAEALLSYLERTIICIYSQMRMILDMYIPTFGTIYIDPTSYLYDGGYAKQVDERR